MSDVAIRITGLGKQYRLGAWRGPYRTLRESLREAVAAPVRALRAALAGAARPAAETLWALKDVSLEIGVGEVVGVIGRNGAGKSTLLKILSHITEPTEGEVRLRGRVGSLLEVGTGFHHELTGRENIYLNGAILGMRRAEIARKFDEIVAFAEVERFIDTPVKHYSSGMYMRLAFSVAAHLEPEILLVDEVLAVGDTAFQRKCLGKMGDVARSGRTVLLVSHNLGAIAGLCAKTLYLESGRLARFGPTPAVIADYAKDLALLTGDFDLDSERIRRRGDGAARFVRARLLDAAGGMLPAVTEGQPFQLELTVAARQPVALLLVGLAIIDPFNNDLFTTLHYDNLDLKQLSAGQHRFTVTFAPNFLARGSYAFRLACFGPNYHEYDHIHHAFSVIVAPREDSPDVLFSRTGSVLFPTPWRHEVL